MCEVVSVICEDDLGMVEVDSGMYGNPGMCEVDSGMYGNDLCLITTSGNFKL